jgi:hypothetical protein
VIISKFLNRGVVDVDWQLLELTNLSVARFHLLQWECRWWKFVLKLSICTIIVVVEESWGSGRRSLIDLNYCCCWRIVRLRKEIFDWLELLLLKNCEAQEGDLWLTWIIVVVEELWGSGRRSLIDLEFVAECCWWTHLKYCCMLYIDDKKRLVYSLWCLTPLSKKIELYHDGQFYWWRKQEYSEKQPTCRKSLTNFMT